MRRRDFTTLLTGTAAWAGGAQAQAWPERVVRIVCPVEQNGAVIIGSTPQELLSFMAAETEKWGQVIAAANVRRTD